MTVMILWISGFQLPSENIQSETPIFSPSESNRTTIIIAASVAGIAFGKYYININPLAFIVLFFVFILVFRFMKKKKFRERKRTIGTAPAIEMSVGWEKMGELLVDDF